MSKIPVLASIIVVVAAVGAQAADVPARPYFTAPAPMRAYSWTGPYLGINVGSQFGEATNSGARPSGAAGGLQAGYNWQTGQWVFGAETDIQLSGAQDTFAPWKFANPWFGTVRGRIGFAVSDRVLIYATAGLAYGGGRVELVGVSESHTHFGWTGGGGVEVGLTGGWSAKVEYLLIDLSDQAYATTGLSHGFETSLLRLGIIYRF